MLFALYAVLYVAEHTLDVDLPRYANAKSDFLSFTYQYYDCLIDSFITYVILPQRRVAYGGICHLHWLMHL